MFTVRKEENCGYWHNLRFSKCSKKDLHFDEVDTSSFRQRDYTVPNNRAILWPKGADCIPMGHYLKQDITHLWTHNDNFLK